MKIEARKKEARMLELKGASPREVARIMPRELSRSEIFKIFERESQLKEDFTLDMLQTDDEYLTQKKIFFDCLLVDKLNNEFNIEAEEYNLGVQQHQLYEDQGV